MPLQRMTIGLAAMAALLAPMAARADTPGFTAAQAKRGQEFYVGSCALCHGDKVDDGEFAPALKGPPHVAYWTGKTAEDVFNYMAAMMPPTAPGSLGGQAYADIYAYLLQSAGGQAGDKELPTDGAALRRSTPTR